MKRTNNKLLAAILLAGLSLTATPARATGYTIADPGAGFTALMNAGFASVVTAIGTATAELTLLIQNGVGKLAMGQQLQIAAAEKIAQAQLSELQTQNHQQAIARIQSDAYAKFGPQAIATTACEDSKMAEQKGAGLAGMSGAVRATQQHFSKGGGGGGDWPVQGYAASVTDPAQSIRRINKELQTPDFEAKSMLPVTTDPTALTRNPTDDPHAQHYMEMLIDPTPTPVLPASQMKSPAGQTYKALWQVQNARMDLARQVVAGSEALFKAAMPVPTSFNALFARAHPGQTAPVYGGKISMASFMDALVESRFENKQWIDDIHKLDEKGLLLEIAQMQAIRLEIEYRNYLLNQQTANMQAADFAQRTKDTMSPALTQLRAQAARGMTSN